MKPSPQSQRLEDILRGSAIVAGGFLGTDPRSVDEIIESDRAELFGLGVTPARIAARLREITALAVAGQGNTVSVGPGLEAMAWETRGRLPCPWPHPGRYGKTVVRLTETAGNRALMWSELNLHLIEAHGFFEGRGTKFRIEPREIVELLFAG